MEQPQPQELINRPGGELLQATAEDISTVARIMTEAAAYKYERGDTIWGEGEFTQDEVAAMVAANNLYLFKQGDQVAASVVLTLSDTRVWGEAGLDDSALYVHKLCVGKQYHGTGATVLKAAEEHARRENKRSLRLDCPLDNHDLRAYYEKHGFVHIGHYKRPDDVKGRDPTSSDYRAALYQKWL